MNRLLVNIDVPDLARAEAFYRDAFELTVGRRFGADGIELLGLAAPLYLLLKSGGSEPAETAIAARDYRRHWTPVHLDFVVENLELAAARVRTAGATAEGDASTYRWGRIAMFADPFGHGFCLIEFLNRGYDEIATP